MKKILYFILFVFVTNSFSQVPDSLKNKWIPGLVTNIGFNQIAFTNWVKGGENSIAWSILANFKYDNISDIWIYKNSIKGTYGRSKIGGGNYITTDNDLYIENLVSYNVGWAVSPFFSNSIRTQITKGYDYKSSPAKQISDLFDPGYITQTFGFTYDKYPNIITRLGIGFQEIVTNRFTNYSDDPTTKDKIEKFKEKGYWIVATDENGEENWDNLPEPNKIVLVMGNEAKGVKRLVQDKSDFLVRIPLHGTISSLNVSVATGIALDRIVNRWDF